MAKSSVGRGRGISTNVPELELIEQIRCRPLLYDKNVKHYRKPGFSDHAWTEVANNLQTTATNCKKRWKSLRDTFIKYYRREMENKKGHKNWNYYKDLLFLVPHVELYRLDESAKTDENITIYMKDEDESYLEEESATIDEKQQMYFAEDHSDIGNEQVTYQIKINDDYDDEENGTENQYEEEERLEDGAIIEIEDKEAIEKPADDHTTYLLLDEANEQSIESRVQNSSKPPAAADAQQKSRLDQPASSATTQRNITDPDERYLLSCLPAFKRFTPQQKAYVRMGIERLFYEVEFENIDEPKNKRRRNS